MKRIISVTINAFLFVSLPLPVFAAPDISPQGAIRLAYYNQITEQEKQQKQQVCRSGSYFGPVAPDRDARYLNCEGRALYGRIDASGRGRLVDENGVTILVVPE